MFKSLTVTEPESVFGSVPGTGTDSSTVATPTLSRFTEGFELTDEPHSKSKSGKMRAKVQQANSKSDGGNEGARPIDQQVG